MIFSRDLHEGNWYLVFEGKGDCRPVDLLFVLRINYLMYRNDESSIVQKSARNDPKRTGQQRLNFHHLLNYRTTLEMTVKHCSASLRMGFAKV